ncbi:MAG: hypothetical protein AMJ54_01850 [Deltaproteobacteria bacterium SG8_13]|nr:MAG: hypothetical protein AMJ54_01850 [Deltaproteobacteria bacterium SG8_13]
MNSKKGVSCWWMVCLAVIGLVLTGCSTGYTPKNAPDVFACVSEDKLEKDIASEAQLQELSCSFKKFEGMDTLHIKVAVKNVSSSDQRFRVNVFLDNGKAVGGLIPRTTKKGLVKPGETQDFVYPVSQMPKQPKGIMLKIGTVSE